jgi:hypothetical protein
MKNTAPGVIAEIILVIFLWGLFSLASAATSDEFRCPNGALITINDKMEMVRLRCDPPDSITTRTVTEGSLDYFHTVDVEEWTYNQGPTSFIYCLTFRNGVLKKIESGGYGK